MPGGIVVRDNLPAHKAAGVRDTVKAAGEKMLYLPYNLDFDPIENAFAKLKAWFQAGTTSAPVCLSTS